MEVGSRVKLNSDGPELVVTIMNVNGVLGYVEVKWIYENFINSIVLPMAALRETVPTPPPQPTS